MRKTSQDGGDTTSITSGIENEIKSKTGAAIKNKRNSIKRKVQNLGNESDDAVIEPLLQKGREKSETELKQSAKYSISKAKTETESDKVKLLTHNNMPKTTDLPRTSETISSVTKESSSHKPEVTSTAPIHNHMNTNVFNNFHSGVGVIAPKSQILVEIDGCNQFSYDSSELIFTTAKIHTDGKTKHMEPVQVTQVPIISTIELGISKTETVNESSKNTHVTAMPVDKKLSDKQSIIYTPTLVNNSAPSTSYKDTISNVSDSQFQSNPGNNNNSSNIVQKDPSLVASNNTEPQALKTTDNLENKGIHSSSVMNDKKIMFTETLTKTTAPHFKPTTANETINTPKLPCITKDTTVGTSLYTKMDDAQKINHPARKDKADETKNMEIKTGVNKNTNNLGNISLHQTDKKEISTNNEKKFVNITEGSNMNSTDKITKNINPTIASKQLLRQKTSITEDSADIILNSNPSCSNYPTTSNINIAKGLNGKITPPKVTSVHSTISDDKKVSNKNVVKSSANNVVVSTKSSTKITPTSSTTKSSLSSTSAAKPVVTTSTVPNTSVITSTVTSTRANSAPSNNVKNKSAVVTKPSVSAVSTAASSVNNSASISREGTYTKLQMTITKPASTTSSTVPVKAPKALNPKSDIVVSSNISATVKAPINSTAKLNTITTPQTISSGKTKDNATIASTVSSTISKPSTSNLSNAPSSSGKSKGNSSATKTVKTTPVTSTVVKNSVPNNKNGPKSSEINKDEKGSKA